jgi:hypothetical protein
LCAELQTGFCVAHPAYFQQVKPHDHSSHGFLWREVLIAVTPP